MVAGAFLLIAAIPSKNPKRGCAVAPVTSKRLIPKITHMLTGFMVSSSSWLCDWRQRLKFRGYEIILQGYATHE
jgi:hypothetical protein